MCRIVFVPVATQSWAKVWCTPFLCKAPSLLYTLVINIAAVIVFLTPLLFAFSNLLSQPTVFVPLSPEWDWERGKASLEFNFHLVLNHHNWWFKKHISIFLLCHYKCFLWSWVFLSYIFPFGTFWPVAAAYPWVYLRKPLEREEEMSAVSGHWLPVTDLGWLAWIHWCLWLKALDFFFLLAWIQGALCRKIGFTWDLWLEFT